MRLPLRRPRRRPGAGRPPAGPSRPQPPRGVRRAGQGDPRDGRRPGDGPRRGRHDHRPQGPGPARVRRLRKRHADHRPGRGDDDRRPLPHPGCRHRGAQRLHEPDSVGLRSGSVRPAGLLGGRAAPRRPRGPGRARSGRVPAAQPRPRRRRGADPPAPRRRRRDRHPRAGGRRHRGGRTARSRRVHRCRVRLVVQQPGTVRRVRPARVRRQWPDRHGRPGERHRRRDGPADPGGRGARDAARGLRAHLPGHRYGTVRRRELGQPDHVQQRSSRCRGRPRGEAPAARACVGRARGRRRGPRAARRPRRRCRQPGPTDLDRRARGHGPRRSAASGSRLGTPAGGAGARRIGLRRTAGLRILLVADVLLPRRPDPAIG